MKNPLFLASFLVSLLFAFSCAYEVQFGSGDSSKTSSVSVEYERASSIGGQVDCSEGSGDATWSDPAIKKCLDSGKVWHFANKYDDKAYCSNVNVASSFGCDRDGFLEASDGIGVNTSSLIDKLDEDSELVSCGESSESSSNSWIMAQFVTCSENGVASNPVTACYVNGPTGCSDGDYDCIVQWCFDNL